MDVSRGIRLHAVGGIFSTCCAFSNRYLDEGATLPAGANAVAVLISARAATTAYIMSLVVKIIP